MDIEFALTDTPNKYKYHKTLVSIKVENSVYCYFSSCNVTLQFKFYENRFIKMLHLIRLYVNNLT